MTEPGQIRVAWQPEADRPSSTASVAAAAERPNRAGGARRVGAAFTRARRRFAWLDHLVRAAVRYDQADGGRLAAAITYYAFFAAFSLALLGFAILGFVLDDPAVLRSVQGYLSENLPRLDAEALRELRGEAGAVAFVIIPVAGLLWIDSLRSSIRAIWRLEEYPGNFFVRQIIDLGVLVALGLLLATSLAAAVGTETLLSWLLVDAAGARGSLAGGLLNSIDFILGMVVNTVLAIAVLTGLPRLRMPLRRVLRPALLVAVGLEALKSVGALYVARAEANPAYHVVAGAVGLLLFLSLLNQLVLFAAALTATSNHGPVTDLAAGVPVTTTVPRPRARTSIRHGLTGRRRPLRRPPPDCA
ncbi:MAG TPA: YhjD/YihY/BrkB family envelope integrity protein [Cryptosporangiaceae bacterium]|nr:YhjD/YihY/BrkB family envelope integrity protein [Cryptosporangiaceae bacterium]